MEEFIRELTGLNPLWIYFVVATVAFAENIFPPFPSDVVIVFAGSLIGVSGVHLAPVLLLATIGSTLGFLTMYKVGKWFGHSILETGKIKFIPLESVRRVELWFQQYGYGVIVANRFLSGTRAVISFFAGLSDLSLVKTTLLSFLSALTWNFILLFAGQKLGENWEQIGLYLEAYSRSVTFVIIVVVLLLALRFYYSRRKSSKS